MNLNRRVPNGLPGGVRGRKFYYFLLLDFLKVKKNLSNSMKINRFRQDKIIRNNMLGIHNIFTLSLYNRNWLLDVATVNPLN